MSKEYYPKSVVEDSCIFWVVISKRNSVLFDKKASNQTRSSSLQILLMSLGKFIEEQIRNAMEAGEFDNLEGAGKPLNLDDYFAAPEDLRMGYSVLKSNKFVPAEVDMMREIGELKEKIKTCEDETEKKKLNKILQEKTLAFTMLMERNRMRKRY
jgi:hypothetical protein